MLLRFLIAALPLSMADASLSQDVSPAASAKPLALVAGGTGRTGRHVVAGLVEEGRFVVRVLARDAEAARALLGDRVEIVAGDVKEPGTLPAAFEGVTHVVSAIGTGGDFFGDNRAEFVDYAGNRNLAEAAAVAGVQHFVLVSSIGVTHPEHPLNERLNDILNWKLKGENALRASGVPYTIVRPGGLRDEPGGRFGLKVRQGDELGGPEEYIPRADVAAVCVRALGNPDAVGKTFEVLGDPSASAVDWSFFGRLQADPPTP